MEFRFETRYDQRGLTAMARALRKTIRKKGSRRSHISGWCIVALAVVLVAAKKKMLPGTSSAKSVFTEEGYTSTTEAASTGFHYETVQQVCETADYFVFLFSRQHGQIYDKATLSGGTAEEFRAFITEKTGKPIAYIE